MVLKFYTASDLLSLLSMNMIIPLDLHQIGLLNRCTNDLQLFIPLQVNILFIVNKNKVGKRTLKLGGGGGRGGQGERKAGGATQRMEACFLSLGHSK